MACDRRRRKRSSSIVFIGLKARVIAGTTSTRDLVKSSVRQFPVLSFLFYKRTLALSSRASALRARSEGSAFGERAREARDLLLGLRARSEGPAFGQLRLRLAQSLP
jgi:hypothetical protein